MEEILKKIKKKLTWGGLKLVFSYANEMKTARLSTAVEKSLHPWEGLDWGGWQKKEKKWEGWDAFRNGLGKACGEPVARQWACCSGSKCLFLSSEFPGSRMAAIPGTGVAFPTEPNERRKEECHVGGVWGRGGKNMPAQLHMSKPCMWTPTDMHAKCGGALTPPFVNSC